MRAFHKLNLTTLVLLLMLHAPQISFAATETPSPDFTEPQPKDDEMASPDRFLKKSIDISPAPPGPLHLEGDDFFYSFRHALSVRTGLLYDSKAASDSTTNPLVVLGVQYLFIDARLKALEAGADLLADGTGDLHLQRRFEFSRLRFRPYLKAGVGLRVQPSDQLATFLKYQNYQIRGAIGFEQLVRLPYSFRLELESTMSTQTFQIGLMLGAVWAY